MTEAAKQAKRAYYRQYYQKNKAMYKRSNDAYWERKAMKAQLEKAVEEDKGEKK